MNAPNQQEQIVAEVNNRLAAIRSKPSTVAVLGPTGVGKSSLVNALTGSNLRTDPVRPCTMDVSDPVAIRTPGGHEMLFYDLPGIGESAGADERYLAMYAKILGEVDIALWLSHADSRSVSLDVAALRTLLAPLPPGRRMALINKLTFGLAKADLIAPPPWVCATEGDRAMLVPQKTTQELFRAKSRYFSEAFLSPFSDVLTSTTYLDRPWSPPDERFRISGEEVTFRGFLGDDLADELKARHPDAADIVDRLADNHRVIAFSSLFRFNLYQLLDVVVNKLGLEAVERFRQVLNSRDLNHVPRSRALGFCNLVVLDRLKNKVVFDLTKHVF
jgi:energy-coupling factor transporter ATP-binding protein EcfA2